MKTRGRGGGEKKWVSKIQRKKPVQLEKKKGGRGQRK